MLRPSTAKIEKRLVKLVPVLAQLFDSRHVLVQSDSPDPKPRNIDPDILEENGLKFFHLHKIDIGFVRNQSVFFSRFSRGLRILFP